MMAAISAGASRQFTATFTAPINDPPKRKSKYAIPLRSRKAMRSPTPTPSRRAAWATRHADVELLAPGAPLAPEHQHLVIGLLGARGA